MHLTINSVGQPCAARSEAKMNTKINMLINIIWLEERRGSMDVNIDRIYKTTQARIGQVNGVWLRCPEISQTRLTTLRKMALTSKRFMSTKRLFVPLNSSMKTSAKNNTASCSKYFQAIFAELFFRGFTFVLAKTFRPLDLFWNQYYLIAVSKYPPH